MTIADLIREMAAEQGQADLARRLGVSEASISHILTGRRTGLGKVAAALLVTYPERREQIIAAMGR